VLFCIYLFDGLKDTPVHFSIKQEHRYRQNAPRRNNFAHQAYVPARKYEITQTLSANSISIASVFFFFFSFLFFFFTPTRLKRFRETTNRNRETIYVISSDPRNRQGDHREGTGRIRIPADGIPSTVQSLTIFFSRSRSSRAPARHVRLKLITRSSSVPAFSSRVPRFSPSFGNFYPDAASLPPPPPLAQ